MGIYSAVFADQTRSRRSGLRKESCGRTASRNPAPKGCDGRGRDLVVVFVAYGSSRNERRGFDVTL